MALSRFLILEYRKRMVCFAVVGHASANDQTLFSEYTAYHRMTRMSMQGSINWMAPEVARGKGYSAKVDIWSCGCLVLEMLTGQVPWHNVRGNVIYLLGTGNSPPLPPSLSDMAKKFLETTFTIDPEMRPTATTLLEHPFTDIDISHVDFEKWSTEAMQLRAELGSSSEPPASDQSSSNNEDSSDSDSEEESDDDEEESVDWGSSESLVASGSGSGIGTPTPSSREHSRPIESETDNQDEYLYEVNSNSFLELAESLENFLAKKL
jgi:serine/threonine protein kinase